VTHSLDESSLAELLAALPHCPDPTAGLSDLTLIEGLIEVRYRPLEGRAVCAAMTVDGVLWVVIDLNKPNALQQAREMLEEWRHSFMQPTADRTG
jgi:hypothetical protein